MIVLALLGAVLAYLLIGAVLSSTVARRAIPLCTDHWLEVGRYSYGTERWVQCRASTCTHPDWTHRVDRSQFMSWRAGLLLAWPVVLAVLWMRSSTIRMVDPVDPLVVRALEARIKHLEKQ